MLIKQSFIFLTIYLCLVLGACAQQPRTERKPEAPAATPEQAQPSPQKVRIQKPVSEPATPGAKRPAVDKNLFNLQITPSALKVNGVVVDEAKALEQLLAKHDRPVITIAAHRCTDSERVSRIMSLAQSYTDTPIAYGSYGEYSDAACQ